jgi:hypothetical protein
VIHRDPDGFLLLLVTTRPFPSRLRGGTSAAFTRYHERSSFGDAVFIHTK